VIAIKVSEAQKSVKETLNLHETKRSPLASLVGVYEELGELSRAILEKEGFKKREKQDNIGYKLAEVFFELLKLAEDCNVDLEKEFVHALRGWKGRKPCMHKP
jgi:NTP pyrophosphatase (non-canonical NTP hydrolase)